MKTSFLILLISLTSFVFKTKEVNRLKEEAQKLYAEKKYLDVTKIYRQLESQYHIDEPQLIYNHANACYRSLQLKTAMTYYKIIADGKDSVLASQALNQMGIISCRSKQLKQGKALFMEALRKNPSNRKAIVNLEWAMIQHDGPKNNSNTTQEQQKAKNKKTKNNTAEKDQKTDPDGNQDPSESLRSASHRNKYMDMNKARLLLESMKNAEKQYIHQHPINNSSNANEPAW
jgi:hypothetical protein